MGGGGGGGGSSVSGERDGLGSGWRNGWCNGWRRRVRHCAKVECDADESRGHAAQHDVARDDEHEAQPAAAAAAHGVDERLAPAGVGLHDRAYGLDVGLAGPADVPADNREGYRSRSRLRPVELHQDVRDAVFREGLAPAAHELEAARVLLRATQEDAPCP